MNKFDYWAKKTETALKAYQTGALSYDEYLETRAHIHDCMVTDFYKGCEELEQLIYDAEAVLSDGFH